MRLNLGIRIVTDGICRLSTHPSADIQRRGRMLHTESPPPPRNHSLSWVIPMNSVMPVQAIPPYGHMMPSRNPSGACGTMMVMRTRRITFLSTIPVLQPQMSQSIYMKVTVHLSAATLWSLVPRKPQLSIRNTT